MNNASLPAPKQKDKIIIEDPQARKRRMKKYLTAYAIISPWLIGFLAFIVGPMLASLYLSFTSYDLLSGAEWIGVQNYVQLFTNDPRFINAIKVTLVFVMLSVPLKLAFALFLAFLFNTGRKGSSIFTTVYYIPSIIGGSVAIAVVWRRMFGSDGAINAFLERFGVEPVSWVMHPDHALSVLILLIIWQFGSPMIIFLAGLRQIPSDLYEAASVDGAGALRQFTHITIPMLTPVIFFNLVMQTIGSFMTFTQVYLITEGGPMERTNLIAVYIYRTAFEFLKMGYASAMAWVVLLIIAVITLLLFLSAKYWVHYEAEGGR
ncbi:carbohydrate ABC transporter permease [Caldalkalibacillus salinus]|uniref:carbohydrate ABC transporter permease n=1 Tax=Caldalkalibacillus salinus TaxID=2803787 RepID=UPI0019205CD0|nr:sugar ABC transporter permease [Caldalkalibacillus salinus]